MQRRVRFRSGRQVFSFLVVLVAGMACKARDATPQPAHQIQQPNVRSESTAASRSPTKSPAKRIEPDVPEEAWTPPEIASGKTPIRVVITKVGWRGGSEALILEQSADVQPLYRALAGNSRLGFACGYHWNFLFEYAGSGPESIDINEHCEVFRRDPKRTWKIVSTAFRKAKEHPSHFVALLYPAGNAYRTGALRRATSQFGVIVPATGGALLLASRERWSAVRIKEVNLALQNIAQVKAVAEYDTGN